MFFRSPKKKIEIISLENSSKPFLVEETAFAILIIQSLLLTLIIMLQIVIIENHS